MAAEDLFKELEPAARDSKIQRTRMERIELSQAISLRRLAYAMESIDAALRATLDWKGPETADVRVRK